MTPKSPLLRSGVDALLPPEMALRAEQIGADKTHTNTPSLLMVPFLPALILGILGNVLVYLRPRRVRDGG